MDNISKELHAFLVKMGYEGVEHEYEHKMEHLVALLDVSDEEDLTHYYGLFGEPRQSLDELARLRHKSPEQTLADIEKSIRKLAVTPEWQMMKEQMK